MEPMGYIIGALQAELTNIHVRMYKEQRCNFTLDITLQKEGPPSGMAGEDEMYGFLAHDFRSRLLQKLPNTVSLFIPKCVGVRMSFQLVSTALTFTTYPTEATFTVTCTSVWVQGPTIVTYPFTVWRWSRRNTGISQTNSLMLQSQNTYQCISGIARDHQGSEKKNDIPLQTTLPDWWRTGVCACVRACARVCVVHNQFILFC